MLNVAIAFLVTVAGSSCTPAVRTHTQASEKGVIAELAAAAEDLDAFCQISRVLGGLGGQLPTPQMKGHELNSIAVEMRPRINALRASFGRAGDSDAIKRVELGDVYLGLTLFTRMLAISGHACLQNRKVDEAIQDVATALSLVEIVAGYSPTLTTLAWKQSEPVFHLVASGIRSLDASHWNRIERWARDFLGVEPAYSEIISEQTRRYATCRHCPTGVADGLESAVYYFADDETVRLPKILNTLSESEEDAIYESALEKASRFTERWDQLFLLPESQWREEAYELHEEQETLKQIEQEASTIMDLHGRAALDSMWDRKTELCEVVTFRTALRLLILHSLVNKYRLRHRQLPVKLTDVAALNEVYNPFTRSPFRYQVVGANGYRLFADPFLDWPAGTFEAAVQL